MPASDFSLAAGFARQDVEMTTVLFEPHHDDCCAFGLYSALRDQAFVITVLGNARVQEQYGISAATRSLEGQLAMDSLGLEYTEWPFVDTTPEWDKAGYKMQNLDGGRMDIEKVWAPLEEEGGHDQHNEVGLLAREVFGDRCHFYATYRRGCGRTHTHREVIPEPEWFATKFKAMSFYASQINLANCRPWFSDWDREWVA